MANKQVFRSVLLAPVLLPLASWAAETAPAPAPVAVAAESPSWANTPRLERKFQQAARHYQKFQLEGRVVYCKKAGTRSMPMYCVSETALRREVEELERTRNSVTYTRSPPGVS